MEKQVSDSQTSQYRASLLNAAKEASLSPGVYLMKDPEGLILYVGKAKNLRNRLSTYFQPATHESPRTEMLVTRIHHFDVILTETEAEALILEATLIKKHRPKFNVRLKDDKAYPYLKIQLSAPFPRIEWTRRVKKDGARYFGPFPSAWAARQVMELLNETLLLRDCSDNSFRHRTRPCILAQMHRCTAPCVGQTTQADYHKQLAEAVNIIEGKSNRLVRLLTESMTDAAEQEEFETAAQYRDQLRNLELVTATQVADEAGSDHNRDIVAIARNGANAHGALLQIRGGKLLAIRHYNFQNADTGTTDTELLSDFLAQHYASAEQTDPENGLIKPAEILMTGQTADPQLFEKALGIAVRSIDPVTATIYERQLLNVAKANAEHALAQAEKRSSGHGIEALEDIQKKLHLPKLPSRIECYDISNTQGEDAVASRVAFIDGAPDKNLYRRYKIRTVQGSNDFAMMKEVLARRFRDKEEDYPELVVVDGGKGQLAQAVAILEELGIKDVSVCGLAKARTERDFQATEVRSSNERVFIPGRKNPIMLLPHTDAFKLLAHIRDEAHRFAISYHRLLRSKRSLGQL